jgi:PKD repeat protein/uncharacterized protein YjiK
LNNPRGLFIDAGNNVFVAEDRGNRVLKYDSAGNNTLAIGTAGLCYTSGYVFCSPQDMLTDSSGNIWVADGHRVVEYTAAGVFSQTIPASNSWQSGNDTTHFNNVQGIALQNGRLYVADSNNHRVQVYDVSSGAPVYSATLGVTGVSGNDSTHFNQPSGLTLDGSGRLFVVDSNNNRVQRCTYTGAWTCSTLAGSLSWPVGISVDTTNNVYFTDAGANSVYKCNSSGTCNPLITGFPGWATDVAVDSIGNVYVSGGSSDAVHKYNSAGTSLGLFKGVLNVPYVADTQRLNTPWGIAVSADGSLYVGEDSGERLVKIGPDGKQQWAFGQAGYPGNDNSHLGNWWAGVEGNPAIDSAARIIFPDTGNHQLRIFNADGTPYSIFGQYGQGQYQFDCSRGIAINPANGDMLVADSCNQRIQVYTNQYVYKATLGVTKVRGSDNAHFSDPWGVAVDKQGHIYVADRDNSRVQKCTLSGSSGTCSTFAGVTGVTGSDFDHLSRVDSVAVDAEGRVYVADDWENRVQVYDPSGAYLTTIGGNWGAQSDEFRNPHGIAVDNAGNVYVADTTNHRVQKFARGVPGWQQVNVNGFGDRYAGWIGVLQPFQGYLYAGAAGSMTSKVWRMASDGAWSTVNTDGFGDGNNREIDAMAVFSDSLYATTYAWACNDPQCNSGHNAGPQVWRSANGTTWENMTPSAILSSHNWLLDTLVEFNGYLYAGTYAEETHGAEIWRTPNGVDWERVVQNGFNDDVYNTSVLSLVVFNGNLYAGTRHGDWINDGHTNGALGGEVWRSSDGTNWTLVNTPGFGDVNLHRVETMQVFQGQLYAYISHLSGVTGGAQVWRCAGPVCNSNTDWVKVADNGFGVAENQYVYAGAVFGNFLYAAVTNSAGTGNQLWRSSDGLSWAKATPYDGFGSSGNGNVPSNAMTVFNGRLYMSLTNWDAGASIWQKTVSAGFSADQTAIRPYMAPHFTNTSAGDILTSTWNFGDGATISSAIVPTAEVTHLYTVPGVYTVTLTVQDGVDTNTITRTNYMQVFYRAYLPMAMRDYNSVLALYDDFNNPAYDGVLNPLKWQLDNSTYITAKQQGGMLVFTNTTTIPANQGYYAFLTQPNLMHTARQLQQFELRMKLSSDHTGGYTSVYPYIISWDMGGYSWYTQCGLGAGLGWTQPGFFCEVDQNRSGSWVQERFVYGGSVVAGIPIYYDTWYTVKMSLNPSTGELKYYLNGTLIDTYLPQDAAKLTTVANLVAQVGVWNSEANSYATRYVDDVKITP